MPTRDSKACVIAQAGVHPDAAGLAIEARTWLAHGSQLGAARRESAMRRISLLVVAAALQLTGCLYANVREPLAYRSPTPADVGGNLGQEVKGESCNHVILWLFAFGDGGYEAAVQDARSSANASMLADVKADTKLLNVLSLYQRQCTTVAARVANVTLAAPAPSAPTAAR